MKILSIFSILGLITIACNNDIALKPRENSSTDSTINFNFKAFSDNDYYRPNSKGIYEADIELYLRTFQEINPKMPITLLFKSNNFGVFVIKNDTLYPDDQTKFLLSDFQNFRQNGHYFTNSVGKQTIEFELEIGKTKRAAKANFDTK